MELKIISRTGKELGTFHLPEKARLGDLRQKFHEKCKYHIVKQYTPDRQRFCLKNAAGPALSDESLTLLSLLSDERTLCFKDLGYQLSWRMVYVIEYGGPLIIAPLLYYFPEKFYGSSSPKTLVQQ